MTEPVAKFKTIDLRDLVGEDDLYAPKPKMEETKEPSIMAHSSKTESRAPTEDMKPTSEAEVDYQSKLLQSTTDDRNKESRDLNQTPKSRDSVDPFTVSMRETAKLEIENLNTQKALLEKLMEA